MPYPLIGLTTGRINDATDAHDRQSVVAGCSIEYPEAVTRSGGAPVLLPRMADDEAVAAMVSRIDALVLTGGGDILSLAYGEEPHPRTKYQDPVRDHMEFLALRLALERNIPILGICRGIQLINVAFGGTLMQDVPSQVPGAVQHYTYELEAALIHSIDIEPDSLLARVLAATTATVNSWHHQAVKAVGKDLRINCKSRDGVIEGLEAADGRPILALQCHPEDCCANYPLFQKPFDWLVEEARKRIANSQKTY